MDSGETLSAGRQLFDDRSITTLLVSNLFTIALALYQQWDVAMHVIEHAMARVAARRAVRRLP